jgi:hypothetical protein
MILLKRRTNSNVDTLIKIMNLVIYKKYIQIFPIIDTVFIIFISFILIITIPSSGQNTAPSADAGRTQTVNAGNIVTLVACIISSIIQVVFATTSANGLSSGRPTL